MMTMTLATARLALSLLALAFVATDPPIYPGAKRDTPQALIEKSSGVEVSATYVTTDSFAQVDSFYRAHGAEDTGARRISAGQQARALLLRGLEERRVDLVAEGRNK